MRTAAPSVARPWRPGCPCWLKPSYSPPPSRSTWSFAPGPSPSTCWLTFDVDFAFNSVLYSQLADVFFNEVRRWLWFGSKFKYVYLSL